MFTSTSDYFDVIVIGAGHAGCEAALASARLGCSTALITMNLDTIARMSCNPAIGGIGKGHLVKEIDALGGEMAKAIDATGIQFRRLNTRKGPAVQASRAQADRLAYHRYMRKIVENTANLHLLQGMVTDLLVENGVIQGVSCFPGVTYRAAAIINTTGTFLNGIIHVGMTQMEAGRDGEFPARELSQSYRDLGFTIGRLKTGTPPRINGNSIDFSTLIEQKGDDPPIPFSFSTERIDRPQVSCYMTQTTAETHRIIEQNLDRSPLFAGVIVGIGPRYCPSIETKIVRFPDKQTHHIFLEPEGLETTEYYANGISTSLPFDVQKAVVNSIPGMENAEITRAGYAIEYDYFPPVQLTATLETKLVQGLYHAGQINGTSGYEEAAAQGLMAGINAVLKLRGESSLILGRQEAYTAVMIDDLINQGLLEPYRMFTSRAEFRLLLREDNADERLTPYGRRIGLVSDDDFHRFERKQGEIRQEKERIDGTSISPESDLSELLLAMGATPLHETVKLKKLVARPEVSYPILRAALHFPEMDMRLIQQVEYDIKYEGYIRRQDDQVKKFATIEQISIPQGFVYVGLQGLTLELRERLTEVSPKTLGQASRIPGMTPAALSLLMISLKSGKRKYHG